MKQENGKTLNATDVLANVQACIKELEEKSKVSWIDLDTKRYHRNFGSKVATVFNIDAVYKELNIFDWWVETLSTTKLKEMESFLKTAIKMGYTGYACFKVGASGCANGMWANKAESEDGYSPKGECLYRSFTPDYISWDAELANGAYAHDAIDKPYDKITLADVKKVIAEQTETTGLSEQKIAQRYCDVTGTEISYYRGEWHYEIPKTKYAESEKKSTFWWSELIRELTRLLNECNIANSMVA